MPPLRALLFASLIAVLTTGTAIAAQHDAAADRYVGATDGGPHKSVLPVETVETITYEVMPRVHQRLEDNTGHTITYSYIIVRVGDDTMYVDPFRFNR